MVLADTHCHLDFPEFDADRNEVIKRAKESGVEYIVNVGSDLVESRRSVELAGQNEHIYAAVGIHPHEADKFIPDQLDTVKELAQKSKVVAIGEIGLDYFKNFSKTENQRPMFKGLLKIAKELNLPVVLHTREAAVDTISILKDFMPLRAVVHCFSGDEAFLKQCLDFGFYISFTCNITYKKADKLRQVLKVVPLERMMLETDCPYLSPEGFRGKRNEPCQVRLLAEEIAKIRDISLETLAKNTTQNAFKFFNIKI